MDLKKNMMSKFALAVTMAAVCLSPMFLHGCGRSGGGSSDTTSIKLNPYDRPTDVTASPDGATLYVANNLRSTISVVNASTLSVVREISVNCSPRHIALNSAGTKMYVTHDFTTCKISPLGTQYNDATSILSVVDLSQNQVTKEIDVTLIGGMDDFTGLREVLWDSTTDKVYAAAYDSKRIVVIDPSAATYSAKINLADGYPVGLSVSSSGATNRVLLATSIVNPDNDGVNELHVINPGTGAAYTGSPWTYSSFNKPSYSIMSQNDMYAFVSNYGSSKISIVDMTNPDTGWADTRYLGEITVGSKPTAMALSSDGSWLLVLNSGAGTLYSIPWGTLKNGTDTKYGYSYSVGSSPSDIAVIGDYAYVTDQVGSALYKISYKTPPSKSADIIGFSPVTMPAGY